MTRGLALPSPLLLWIVLALRVTHSFSLTTFSIHQRGIRVLRLHVRHSASTDGDNNSGAKGKSPASAVFPAFNSSGIRLNKCFRATHSRRQADALIESGRVRVNGIVGEPGIRVQPGDVVSLDGTLVDWEELNFLTPVTTTANSSGVTAQLASAAPEEAVFDYIKYWKPSGVTCTTDCRIAGNIVDSIVKAGYEPKNRFFPVGRLDKPTTGLILLTSDGRLPNAISRAGFKQPKVYQIQVDRVITNRDIQHLREGVMITTEAQRDSHNKGRKSLTAKTLPCIVTRIGDSKREIQMTIIEGRNRQIRKMLQALDYQVVHLHRVQIMNITLDRLKGEGSWAYLSSDEMRDIQQALCVYSSTF